MTTEVTFVAHDGATETHDGAAGESVMRIATRNAVPGIVAECGGSMSCSTCHVFVEHATADLPAVGEIEDEMLDLTAVEREEASRLSCQLVLPDGARVRVRTPADQI